MQFQKRLTIWLIAFLLVPGLLLTLATFGAPSVAHAQQATETPTPGASPPPPTQSDNTQKFLFIGQLVLDLLQGKTTSGVDALFQQTQQSASNLLNNGGTDIFFLDFGNPNLRINEFAGEVARNLLLLTPLYVFGYLGILIFDVWKERPIPNPILYAVLVIFVMLFLAAFAVITQGLSELGRALAVAISGSGDAFFVRAGLYATIVRVLANLQKVSGVLAILALLIAIVEMMIVLIQLAYRGISMAIWRLLGVLLIPLSVLLEGVNPKTAGRVIAGFFESYLDMIGKIALLLIVLSIAASEGFASSIWFVLPAGLLIVVLSWKFFGVLFTLIRDAVGRAWSDMVPATATETIAPLPAAAEAARAREIDEERRRMLEE
jgi:hypothetical protein